MNIKLLALTALWLASLANLQASEPARPNVLLIILEDWGPYLHCYGESEIYTPNLDQLASEGQLYKNCFSSGPVCSVGRSTLMVGLSQYTTHTQQHRTHNPKPDLPAGVGAGQKSSV
jgi:arylsulfatase A-like enzyme